MRDMRIALCNGYEMKISENRKIRIADEAGRGAGCIVYDAIYWDQMQIKHKIRVRECYPAYIQLTRAATGELVPSCIFALMALLEFSMLLVLMLFERLSKSDLTL